MTRNAICRSPASSLLRRNVGALGLRPDRARHLRQLRRRHRHPEEAHRQRVQHLRVGHRRDRTGRKQAREQRVHVRADLHDASPHEHRQEAPDHLPHRTSEQRTQPQPAEQPEHRRKLDGELEQAAHHRAPCGDFRQVEAFRLPTLGHQRRDDRQVPDHRRDVGEEEPPVAVEHAETPRGEHQQSRAREENPHQPRGGLALRALESRSDDVDEPRGQQDAREHQHRDRESQERRDGARGGAGIRLSSLRPEAGVHRDERGGEHAFAEQVLEEVGNPERGVERVGRVGGAEVVGEDSIANQADDPAQQDAGRDHYSRP